MQKNSISFVLILLLRVWSFTEARRTIHDQEYVAGVVAYTPETTKTGAENLSSNLEAYIELIQMAQEKNVDIFVFPEATLNYFMTEADMYEHAIILPEINDTNAMNESQVLSRLSAKIREAEIYAVVNLVEKSACSSGNTKCKDNFELYNTNVVFDRRGVIVSKYRKFNLYIEPFITAPLNAELATFVTDFGVTFGHFICFDMLFLYPARKMVENNVRHILYPSMWFSHMPFFTASQFQMSWAYANNVVLLAAGENVADMGTSGTGIYFGTKGIYRTLMSPRKEKQLLVSKVPKNPDVIEIKEIKDYQSFSVEEMMPFKTKLISVGTTFDLSVIAQNSSLKTCDQDFCCRIEFASPNLMDNFLPGESYIYKLAVGRKILSLADREVEVSYCAIVSCSGPSTDDCGNRLATTPRTDGTLFEYIRMSVSFNGKEKLLVMPSTLDRSLMPMDVNAFMLTEVDENLNGSIQATYTMETRPNVTLSNFHTFGILARTYGVSDNGINSGSLLIVNLTFILALITTALVMILYS